MVRKHFLTHLNSYIEKVIIRFIIDEATGHFRVNGGDHAADERQRRNNVEQTEIPTIHAWNSLKFFGYPRRGTFWSFSFIQLIAALLTTTTTLPPFSSCLAAIIWYSARHLVFLQPIVVTIWHNCYIVGSLIKLWCTNETLYYWLHKDILINIVISPM